MLCRSCHSPNADTYPTEVNIHPPRAIENLDRPTVWAFPSLVICSECGFGEFALSAEELHQFRNNKANSWSSTQRLKAQ